MHWNNVIKNFEIQWKALKTKRDEDTLEVPKISKSLPIIKWTEAFQEHFHRVIGVRMIPLAYVIRMNEDVPTVAPPLQAGQPHSEAHGSIEGEMIARASHTHTMFRDNNAAVYYALEEATRSTSYAASIKPFQRTKNGCGALMALTNQYAGNDKWEAEIRKQDDLLHTRVWKGQSNIPLEGFIAQHRNAFMSMQQCAEHIAFQLPIPNELTRVGYLLEGIQCSNPGLQAAMASVQTDDGVNRMRAILKGNQHTYCPMTLLQGNGQQEQNDLQQTSQILGAPTVQMPVQLKYLRQPQRMEKRALVKHGYTCDTTRIPNIENCPLHKRGNSLSGKTRIHRRRRNLAMKSERSRLTMYPLQ